MTKRKIDISDSINGLVEETRESFIAQVHNIKWYDVNNVMDHIKAEIVTKEESSSRIASYQKHTETDIETLACASCGMKEQIFQDHTRYQKFRDKRNYWEKCSIEAIPQCFLSDQANINPNLLDYNGHTYNLYATLCQAKYLNFCPDCSKFKTNGKLPLASISSGLLFDVNTNLCQLSFTETLLLTRYHPYLQTVKITKPGNSEFNFLKGHVICYEHDGLQVVNNHLFTEIDKVLTIIYVGPKEQLESAKKHLLNMEMFKMDATKLLQWLIFLKNNNQFYSTILLQSVEELEAILDSLKQKLLQMLSNVEMTQEEENSTAPLNEEIIETPKATPSYSLLVQNINDTDASPSTLLSAVESCLRVSSSREMINEYSYVDEILYLAFPTLFPYGKGLPQKLCKSFIRKLMLFYDNRFSKNTEIQFYLYSVSTRMNINQKSAVYVKANPHAIQEVSSLVNDPLILQKLATSIEDPQSQVAKGILHTLLKHCTIAGASIPFSDFEKQYSLVELIAYIRVFGLPTYFITVSPNQKPNSTVIDSTQKFYHDLQYLFQDLVGLIPEHLSRKSQPAIEYRNKGIFGTPIAYYSVVESQARGSLHVHFLLWANIPSWLFTSAIGNPELEKLIAQLIDSTVSAHVPDIHLLNYHHRKSQPEQIFDSTDPYVLATTLNTHRHSFTCRKGKNGISHCRMAFGRPLQPRTAPVEIVQDSSGKYIGVPVDGLCSPDPFSLFSTHETRPITWQLQRPKSDFSLELDGYPISNAYITEFNLNLTMAVKSNTCVSFLGDTLASKTAAFYLCKYFYIDLVI